VRHASARALLLCTAAALVVATVGAVPSAAQASGARLVPGMQVLRGVWCGADGVCLGVGYTSGNVGGVAVLRANGTIGPVHPVGGTSELHDIDCAPGGGCIAVGRTPGAVGVIVEVSRNGTPGAVRPVAGTSELFDVACPAAATCVATGHTSAWPQTSSWPVSTPLFVVVNGGEPAPPRYMPRGTRRSIGIDCPTETTCLAVSGSSVVILTNTGGDWAATLRRLSSDISTGYPSEAISCPSSTTCQVTATHFIQRPDGYLGVPGMVPVSAEGVVGQAQILYDRSGNAYDISCISTRTCTVVGHSNFAAGGLIIDVLRGTPTVTIWPGSTFLGVSCVGPATCGVVGSSGGGAVFLWHGPVPA
jgi:hypothetical protein